ncbi:MAG: FAD-dependent oxidoreductase, partial [Firmicutes bacterium]|nr:FAD-dependent oxidoreductase [Bacillota bacterium]
MLDYTIAILGGGPGGYVAAIKAAQLGAKTVLIEGGNVGGVCLNEGCIPTKTLLKSAKVYQDILNSENYGIKVTRDGAIALDWKVMLERKNRVVNQLTGGVRQLLERNGVEVIHGYGYIKDPHSIEVDGRTITAEHLIIATGSSPNLPPIPGLSEALADGSAVTSTGALELREI